MEEIKKGEYVKTKSGYIAKVEYVEYTEIDKGHRELDICTFDKPIYYDYGEGYYNLYSNKEFDKYIKKHSFNIIDLIEVGDVVDYESNNNGVKVKREVAYVCTEKEDYKWGEGYISTFEDEYIRKEHIKSIVTKEMFSSMEYKVGE